MALIHTTLGDLDDSLLIKHTGGVDNDVETTTWVEYCLKDCDGAAHQTQQPEGPGCFCRQHIHRSVAMALKRGVFGEGIASPLS
jgi:hypothetical protein